MSRVLFHYPVLNTGGAEMSSLRLMKALADRGWDITLVVTTGGGSLEPLLDPRVRLYSLRPRGFGHRFMRARGVAQRLAAAPDLIGYLAMAALGEIRALAFLGQRFDAAATLLHGTSSAFVRKRVRAGRRLHFIRNDLRGVDPDGAVAAALSAGDPAIDAYVCVSEVARRSLVEAVPESAAKAHVIHNILDPDAMRRRMTEGDSPFRADDGTAVRLLTVCRLAESAKALTRMARVARRLVEAGHDFRWYVVGDGPDRAKFEAAIAAEGVADRLILAGRMSNPFPAYRDADVVVMASRYEGLCGMVNEGKVAGRPVVATRVSGIEEQLVDGETGLIVENDEDALVAGLTRILSDPALRARLTNDRLPPAMLDDAGKLARLEALMTGRGAP
ncbi:MAG: glycosyltransferase [Brevundimonas sp.]